MTIRVIRGLHNIRAQDQGGVLSFGNFDGVHRGHQALIKILRELAPDKPAGVVCFEPQPLEYLRPEHAPLRLQSLAEKLRHLDEYGLSFVLVLPFTKALAEMPPADFIDRVVVKGMRAAAVAVGDDWRFGRQRQGDVTLLRQLAQQSGFQVHQLDTLLMDECRVSSTRVRQALAAGELATVKQCLGRNYRLRGRVVHGQKLGRELGAPTANVSLKTPGPLKHGVYCVRLNGQIAVANIGTRPTLDDSVGEHLEVHLLKGTHQLYGQMVVVEFEKFIRPEQAFDDLASLQTAIGKDVAEAKQYFEQESA